MSAQSWHYNNPEQGDFADADVRPDATGPNKLASWRFFARPEAGGTVQYVQLSAIVSELSALSSEISAGGGGGTILGNTTDSVRIGGDIEFQAALSCNISCWTQVVGQVPTIKLGVYYI